MAKIIILGAGRVGKAIALDLAGEHEVLSLDIDTRALEMLQTVNPAIKIRQIDLLSTHSIATAIVPADLVISAVPGEMGYQTLEAIIRSGKNVVDISFFPEDALQLDDLARQKQCTAVVDMGIAPGMSNVILGHHDTTMNIETFVCMVGGLPKNPQPPFNYKAPFSPLDVIEEYTRPARIMVNGKPLTKPPLSDIELNEFSGIGVLEAFNTDGLRTLLTTMSHIPNMVEKTLRYPGHARLIEALSLAGFFSKEPLTDISSYIRPLDVTANLLNKAWQLDAREAEFTVMRVVISGTEQQQATRYQYDLYDEFNPATNITSMARCTGYTCTAAANLVLQQQFQHRGIIAPEFLGADTQSFDFITAYLKDRGIAFTRQHQHT